MEYFYNEDAKETKEYAKETEEVPFNLNSVLVIAIYMSAVLVIFSYSVNMSVLVILIATVVASTLLLEPQMALVMVVGSCSVAVGFHYLNGAVQEAVPV